MNDFPGTDEKVCFLVRPQKDEIKYPLATGKIIIDLFRMKPIEIKDFVKEIMAAKHIAPYIMCFRIGISFLMICSPVISAIQNSGGRVFADLKFYHSPDEIIAVIKALARYYVKYFSVHAVSGKEIISLVKKTAQEQFEDQLNLFGKIDDKERQELIKQRKPVILAETILPSMDSDDLMKIYKSSATELFPVLVAAARDTGMDGMICSDYNLANFRTKRRNSDGLMIIVPANQKTVSSAVKRNIAAVIIGNDIIKPPEGVSYLEAIEGIAEKIHAALSVQKKIPGYMDTKKIITSKK